MKAVLEEYLAFLPTEPDGALFPGTVRSPTPMTRSTGWRRWKKALRAVGLDMKGRGCHAARHGLGLALWKEKGDLRLVSAQLGHTDLRSTMIYTAPLPEDVEDALDATCPLGGRADRPRQTGSGLQAWVVRGVQRLQVRGRCSWQAQARVELDLRPALAMSDGGTGSPPPPTPRAGPRPHPPPPPPRRWACPGPIHGATRGCWPTPSCQGRCRTPS